MFLKRFLLLALFVAVVAVIINYIGNKEKPYFKEITDASLDRISDAGYALNGKLSFYNPSYFSAKLAAIKLDLYVNNVSVGTLDQPMDGRIAAESTYYYPFEIRVENEMITDSVLLLEVRGEVQSGGFNGFTIQIQDTFSLKRHL
jgi:LEA14-like dessication related protein